MNPEKPMGVKETRTEEEIEEELLNVVLEVAGDDEKMVREGIIKALHGVNDRARRTYLWNELDRKAKERIRRAQRKTAA